MDDHIQVLNVRLPTDVVAWIDKLVKQGVYSNRSEALRDFIRDYVRKRQA